jgi:hypothetical protein
MEERMGKVEEAEHEKEKEEEKDSFAVSIINLIWNKSFFRKLTLFKYLINFL